MHVHMQTTDCMHMDSWPNEYLQYMFLGRNMENSLKHVIEYHNDPIFGQTALGK